MEQQQHNRLKINGFKTTNDGTITSSEEIKDKMLTRANLKSGRDIIDTNYQKCVKLTRN